MIKIVENKFEGLYAIPIYHPITSANPAPWLITEMKIEPRRRLEEEVVLFIRGEKSMWFQECNCRIGTLEEMKELIERELRLKEQRKDEVRKLQNDLRKTFNLPPG